MENSTRNIVVVVCMFAMLDCVSEWLLLSGWYVRIFHLNFFFFFISYLSPSTTTLVKQQQQQKSRRTHNEIMD